MYVSVELVYLKSSYPKLVVGAWCLNCCLVIRMYHLLGPAIARPPTKAHTGWSRIRQWGMLLVLFLGEIRPIVGPFHRPDSSSQQFSDF